MVQIDVDLMKTMVKRIDSFPEVWVAKDLRTLHSGKQHGSQCFNMCERGALQIEFSIHMQKLHATKADLTGQ